MPTGNQTTEVLDAKQKEQAELRSLRYVIDHAGQDEDGNRVSIADAMATPDASLRLEVIFTQIVQDAIQMQMVGESLLPKIRHDTLIGESTSFRWVGAGNIPDVDVAEGGEYPDFTLAAGTRSTVRIQFKKRGLSIRFTEEIIKYNQWDVVRLTITQAALALARAKEQLIFNVLNDMGVVVFDNVNPGASLRGVCNGRDITGNLNGAITQLDLVEMYSAAMANGYLVDVILVHPWAYPIFQKDPMLRHQGYVTGNPNAYLNSALSPMNAYENPTVREWRKQGREASGAGAVLSPQEMQLLSTGAMPLPSYSPLAGIRIVTSHQVPFDPINQTTSIIMIDTQASAVLNEQVPLTVDSWEDKGRDQVIVRLKESYSIDVLDEGRGVILAKNVPLVANELFVDPIVTITDLT